MNIRAEHNCHLCKKEWLGRCFGSKYGEDVSVNDTPVCDSYEFGGSDDKLKLIVYAQSIGVKELSIEQVKQISETYLEDNHIETDEDLEDLIKRRAQCHFCEFRHGGCIHKDPPSNCKEYRTGKCYSCKYYYGQHGELNDQETDAWFKRGCESWFPSSLYCTKRKRLSRKRKKRLKKNGFYK